MRQMSSDVLRRPCEVLEDLPRYAVVGSDASFVRAEEVGEQAAADEVDLRRVDLPWAESWAPRG